MEPLTETAQPTELEELDEARGRGRGARPRGPGSLLQPRALLARLQRPGAAARRGPVRAAARAGQVRRDLGVEPGRVLHGPGRQPAATSSRPGPRPRPPTGCRRRRRSRRSATRVLDQRERAGRTVERELRPALAEHGIRILDPGAGLAGGARGARAPLRAPGLPGADAAGDRARPPVPVHLQPLALARRRAPRPGEGQRDPRPGQGAEGAPAPVPRRRRRTATRWSRSTR